MLAAPRFIPRPSDPAPAEEYEHPTIAGLIGCFDLEWTQADRSVGEAWTGYVATLYHARLGDLGLDRDQVRQAIGAEGLREWESDVGREATEQ